MNQSQKEKLVNESKKSLPLKKSSSLKKPKKARRIQKFLRCFIAVDNDVNEQTVMGVLFAFVTLGLIVLHVAKVGDSGLDLIITTGTMTLSCFGIAGLKGGGM